MDDDKLELQTAAMQIILHAGDARAAAEEAVKTALEGDAAAAREEIADATALIAQAHASQTDIIQKEAGGHDYPYSILFAHAQDTMMTIDLQIRISSQLIDVIEHTAA